MHATHVASQLALIQHVQRVIGTRLLPDTRALTAAWRPTSGALPFAAGVRGDFQPIAEGTVWGHGRENAWFHLTGTVPADWAGKQVVAWVDLNTEALVYAADGRVLQGLNTGSAWDDTNWRNSRPFIHLFDACRGGEAVDLWLDAACWAHPGAVDHSGPQPGGLSAAGTPLGQAHRLRLAVFEQQAWELFCDIETLLHLVRALPETSARRARALRTLLAGCERWQQTGELSAARAVLAPALACRANTSDLEAVAIGHGHLDSAWLWDFATGRRKIARTAANQLNLIERFPGYVFGCSAAVHYRWLEEDHPELWRRVRDAVAAGSWEPLGPMWCEPDCLAPSGEALIRQCLHGARYFRAAFGHAPASAWLPDTFGFTTALPQILRHCGCDALFTTKISWNPCNPPRHFSFSWHGHDGSAVIVHYPPDGSYEASLLPGELIQGQGRYAEKAETDCFLTAFGYGDGGGGPHERHLMRARRGADLEGMPRIRLGQVARVHQHLRERAADLPAFSDELYLEQHQGTLTTHGDVKRRNRHLEQVLAATEILLAHAPAAAWPAAALERLWKDLLLCQFHDVLPGTSIRTVYEQVLPLLDAALDETARLGDAVVGAGTPDDLLLFNSLAAPWEGVIELPTALHGRGLRTRAGAAVPTQNEGERTVAWVQVPALGFLELVAEGRAPDARLAAPAAPVLGNGRISAAFDPATGLLRRLGDTLPADGAANRFTLSGDDPAQWDAWNLELGYRNGAATARCRRCALVVDGPVRQVVELEAGIGSSTIRQRISLAKAGHRLDCATVVDWRETHRFLRVAFPTAITAPHASYHIQHGHVQRPTIPRDEAETARIEYVAHQYVDLSRPGLGLAVLNDGKYGHSVHGTTIELGLVRAPVFPDPEADRGSNEFTYALLPHRDGSPDGIVAIEAERLNRPPRQWHGSRAPIAALPIRLESTAVTLEALKRAEDGQGWVLRLCNRTAGGGAAVLAADAPRRLTPCDGLEDACAAPLPAATAWEIPLPPFAVRSFRIAD